VYNVSQWPNLRHLAELIGGAVDLLEALRFREMTENARRARTATARWEWGPVAMLKPRETKVVRTRGKNSKLVLAECREHVTVWQLLPVWPPSCGGSVWAWRQPSEQRPLAMERSPGTCVRVHRLSKVLQPLGIRFLGVRHARLFVTDPRRLWDFLELTGVVTRLLDRKWERVCDNWEENGDKQVEKI